MRPATRITENNTGPGVSGRGSDVLLQVLGEEFSGVLGADYFSAYRKYMGDFGILVQFCLAHLIRDVKYLTTLSDKATHKYGTNVLARLRRLGRQKEGVSPQMWAIPLDLVCGGRTHQATTLVKVTAAVAAFRDGEGPTLAQPLWQS